MQTGFHPTPGQVILLEYEGEHKGGHGGQSDHHTTTGLVIQTRETAHLDDPGRLSLEALRHVEKVQRRSWPRRLMNLAVSLVPLDEADVIGVAGHTLDLGVGGARVRTVRPLPSGCDPSLAITLPDGTLLLVPTRVVYADVGEGGCDYRLAFCDLDETDAARLAELVGVTAAT